MRSFRLTTALLVAMLLALAPVKSIAEWAPGGIPVPGAYGAAGATADGQGGVFVAWGDSRNYSVTAVDVFATRMTPAGLVAAGFPQTGLPVCTALDNQYACWIVGDFQGGAYLYWLDERNAYANGGPRLYASRITVSGAIAPGWPVDGLPVSSILTRDEHCGPPVPDNDGGAYFLWDDYSTGSSDVYVQRLTVAGVPAAGWPAGGLPIATGQGDQAGPWGVSDGAGGALVVYVNQRPDAPGVYATRITPSGAIATGWPVDGLRLGTDQGPGFVVADGLGGAYVSLDKPATQPQYFSAVLSVIRFTGAGQIAPGWSFNGNVVCDTVNFRVPAHLAADAAGNVFAQWYDYRDTNVATLFAVRLNPDGAFAAGWPKNGRRVSTLLANQYNTGGVNILADGVGGMYSAFETQTYYASLCAIQHLGPDGSPVHGWTSDGSILNSASGEYSPFLASDGWGGAYVVWDNGATYIQHYLNDGVVAVQLSLVSAEVKDGRVLLDWFSPDAASLNGTVYRRTSNSDWASLGNATGDGSGHIRYEDRAVSAGERYDYKLGYIEDGVERYSGETWVEIPAPRLALDGLRPNPAVGALTVSFSLPTAEAASLEILDVTGRRIAQREVGSLGAGPHVLRLGETGALSPGIYWLRLQQGGRVLLARGAVVR